MWFSVLWLSAGCSSVVLSRLMWSSVLLLNDGCFSVVLSRVMRSCVLWLSAGSSRIVLSRVIWYSVGQNGRLNGLLVTKLKLIECQCLSSNLPNS